MGGHATKWGVFNAPFRGAFTGRLDQFQHAVERVDGDLHLGRPSLIRVQVQPVADHRIHLASIAWRV